MSATRSLIFAALVAALPATALHAAQSKPARAAPPLQAMLQKSGTQLSLAVPDVAKLRGEDAQRDAQPGTPLRYGLVQQVRLDAQAKSAAGQWRELPDGRLAWRLEVVGKGATSLEFGFSRFRLPHGAVLSISAIDGSQALIPLTDADNPAAGGALYTPMLQADAAVLELSLPADKREFLELELATASYGYRDPFAAARAKSGSCNIDTACPEGDDWRDQIASVAGYSFSDDIERLMCTGTLMNTGDLAADATQPRFSTAYHCVSTQAKADTMVFYWGYESPTCRTPGSGASGTALPPTANSRAVQLGGATLLATHRVTDFTAVELKTPVPDAAQAYYSGWDRSGDVPQGSVGIHHPNGDEKRISFNHDPLTTMRNCIIASTDTTSHWRVDDWEQGTTERGSSGSGLWNPANGLLVGVLSGGEASCGNPGGYDCYGRLSAAWEADSPTGDTVRAAFDRSGTNPQTMPGSGTCNAPVVTLTSNAFDSAPRAGANFQLRATASGGAGGYTYLWDVDGDGVVEREGSERIVTVSFPSRHSGNVRVQVRDAEGCVGSASRALDVAAPVIEVASVGTPQQVCGTGAGRIDPGARYSVPVTLRNTGNAPLAAGARALFAPAGDLALDIGPNQFGYVGSSECGYNFIDLAQGTHAVAPLETHEGNDNGFGPLDDARTPTISLGGQGIHLYGTRYRQAVMSTNGYVSFDPDDTGSAGSITGDAPSCDGGLDEGSLGPQLRPFHDDLRVSETQGAGLRYRYFATCPRPSLVGETAGCHVFQWSGMEVYGQNAFQGQAEFQAVVYQGTGEVVYQYKSQAQVDETYTVIGLVDASGGDALRMSCPQETGIVPASETALCAFAPSAQPASQGALRLETPTLSLPSLAAGASTTVHLPVQVRDTAACGAALRFDYIGAAAKANHSTQASSHSAGNVDAACQAVTTCPAQVPDIDLRDGNYYNRERSGNGFNNYVFGGNWYTAAADHTPVWYQAAGGYVDNLLSTPLIHVKNTAGPRGLVVERQQAGHLHMARIDATHALMAWRFNDGRAGAELIELTTADLPRANPNYTQHWYPPSQSGWGLDLESVMAGQRLDVALTYFYDAHGTPRWVLGDGTLNSGGLDLYRPHCPGCPRYQDWRSRTLEVGKFMMRWSPDGSAIISTDITLPPPLQGSWERQGVRFIPIGAIRP